MKFEEFRRGREIRFSVDKRRYTIARLREPLPLSQKIFAIAVEKDSITAVAQEGAGLEPLEEEKFFRLITFDVKLPFDLSGFLSNVSALLAAEGIPIFAISSYSTDHILVKEELLGKALKVLKEDGFLQS